MPTNIPVFSARDKDGNIIEIPALKGDSYVLTAADKQEIAEIVLAMLQSGDEVQY